MSFITHNLLKKRKLNELLEVGVGVKPIQEISQHLVTELVLFLQQDTERSTELKRVDMPNAYLVGHHPSSLYSHPLDELEQVHHSLCLHPLHLSM